jgi:hypothetical protein
MQASDAHMMPLCHSGLQDSTARLLVQACRFILCCLLSTVQQCNVSLKRNILLHW